MLSNNNFKIYIFIEVITSLFLIKYFLIPLISPISSFSLFLLVQSINLFKKHLINAILYNSFIFLFFVCPFFKDSNKFIN